MTLRSAPLWLLVLEVVALQHGCLGGSSHSLKIVCLAIMEPGQNLSHVVFLGYVDSQIFARYDSNSRNIQPRVPWMEKSGKDIPKYWQALTDVARNQEHDFRYHLGYNVREMTHDNKNKDLHMIQIIATCDLLGDGSKRGFLHTSNRGNICINTVGESNTENCIELLKTCLSYGNETLLRTESPMVTVSSRMEMEDGMEMHICQVHGFYPREIDASWMRDGKVWLQDTFHGSVAPNADGTYHYWLSIWIDPKERGRYRCHVEHDGLQEPLDMALKEPTNSKSNLGLIIGCVVAGLVLACVIVGTLIFLRNHSQVRGELQGDTSS